MSHDANGSINRSGGRESKKPWAIPTLTYEGRIEELVQGGTGKSGVGGDSGDSKKPHGQG